MTIGFRRLALLAAALSGACVSTGRPDRPRHHLVAGTFEPGRGPDGNSLFLEAPGGLILVDTGRHPEHRDRLLGFARSSRRRVAAVINTHWHLDHSTNNDALRAAYPRAPLYATTALEGALTGFLARAKLQTEKQLAASQIPAENRAEARRFLAVMAAPDALRPTRPVLRSGPVRIAGRLLQVHVSAYAATEADLWIHDPKERLVIAGDLVVAEAPFFDTACPEGWRRALDEIARIDFDRLYPGHGPVMDKAAFLDWRHAFNALLDCAAGKAERQACISGWRRDAARFIAPERAAFIDRMIAYYLDERLRAEPAQRDLYCPAA